MHSFKAHSKPIYSIEFAADGRSILTAAGASARRWSIPAGEQLHEWPADGLWRFASFDGASLSPDGERLACGGVGLIVWSADGYEILREERQICAAVAFSNDGETVFAFGHDGLFRWRVRDAELLPGRWGGTRESNNGRKFPFRGLAVHPSEPILASSFGVQPDRESPWESAIEFFAIDTGESLRLIRTPFHYDHLSKLCFSPDGSVVVATSGPMWRAWRVDTGEEIVRAKTGRKHLLGVAFTADGERLITVGNDASARVWNVDDGSEERSFDWDVGPLTCLAVSPDGCLIAAGSRRGKVVLWDDEPR